MEKFKVIVVPKKGAVRGILSRPITTSTRLELTKMQIIRCINSGADVYNENADGTKTPFSLLTTNEAKSINKKAEEEAAKARKEAEDAEAKRLAEEAEKERRKQADAERKAKEEADRIAREEEEKKAAAEAEAKRKAEEESKKAAERQKKLDNLNVEKTDLEGKLAEKDAAIESEEKDVADFKAMLDGEEDEESIASVKEEIKNHEIFISSLKDERNKLQKKLNNVINQIRTI